MQSPEESDARNDLIVSPVGKLRRRETSDSPKRRNWHAELEGDAVGGGGREGCGHLSGHLPVMPPPPGPTVPAKKPAVSLTAVPLHVSCSSHAAFQIFPVFGIQRFYYDVSGYL